MAKVSGRQRLIVLTNAVQLQRLPTKGCTFSRTWVRQEVFGANSMEILSPRFQRALSMQELQRLVSIWKDIPADDEVACFKLMADSYRHCGTDDPEYIFPAQRLRYTTHWLQNLHHGSRFEVTDDRDRIYGIFGMITSPATRFYVETRADIMPDRFPIDYEKSVSAVYGDIIRYLINTDRNLDCLLVFEDRRQRTADISSWAIDWRTALDRSFLALPPSRTADERAYGLAREQNHKDRRFVRLEGMLLFEVLSLSAYNQVVFQASSRSQDPSTPQGVSGGGNINEFDDTIRKISASYMHCYFPDDESEYRETAYVPRTTRIDDCIVLLQGGRCPFVLRWLQKKHWQLIGPAIIRNVLWPAETSRFRWALSKDRSRINWDPGRLRTFYIY
jgi:hypothetical protein